MQWKSEDHGMTVFKWLERSKGASKQLTHNSISRKNILPKQEKIKTF